MEAAPEKGDFFHREENPFCDIDEAKQPSISEAPEELETNVNST